MYEAFYNLSQKPFSLNPDPNFLYGSENHRAALAVVEYGLTQTDGIIVLTGEVGSGKTTLVRRLVRQADSNFRIGVVNNTYPDVKEFMKSVLLAFDHSYDNADQVGLYRIFRDAVLADFAAGKRTVLIVDEAQNLETATLEALRMLSNLNDDNYQRLQLFLVGQQELLERLKRADLRQFAQRITAHYNLEPLSIPETAGYIWHRLKLAGGNSRLFDLGACQEVHAASKGIPRLINMICEMALVYGYAEDLQKIDASVIKEVIDDRSKSGIRATFFDPGLQLGSAGK